jgi:hypothetical protein
MQLRVFSNSVGDLWIQISGISLPRDLKWCVPILPDDDSHPSDDDHHVRLRFQGKKYKVPFFWIQTVGAKTTDKLREIGVLDDDSSRDVMNNIADRLEWGLR